MSLVGGTEMELIGCWTGECVCHVGTARERTCDRYTLSALRRNRLSHDSSCEKSTGEVA